MKAPKVVPTCTTWSTFQDENIPIGQGTYKRYYRYLESIRKSRLAAPSDPKVEITDPATPMPPRRPKINLEVLVSLVDFTWNPDLHQGLDYLWTIMDESERKSFLDGITTEVTERTSTSMSTVVPMPSKAAPPVTKPLQPQPPREGQEQGPGSTATVDQQGESGDAPASSSQTEQAEVTDAQQGTEAEASEAQQDTGAAVEESDRGSVTEPATVHSSQLATAGSTTGGAEQPTEAAESLRNRKHLRTILLVLSTWTHMLIFSTFCQQQHPDMWTLKAPM